MRKTIVLWAVIGTFLVGAPWQSFSSSIVSFIDADPALVGGSQKPPTLSNQDARIARIENGLLPPIIIKGRPTPTMTIADRMKHFNVPGVSIAFFGQGRILWTRTYGFADAASQKPVTPETLFQAASISKPVSALAALRLVEEGTLSLDEDVNVKLRTWKVPENEFTKEQKVTLRRILSHSAGLTVHGFPGYASDEPVPTMVQILNGDEPANTAAIRVDTVPGTSWRYSGGGYVVVQILLTDVAGKPFPQILRDLVLEPAGMTHSTYEQPLPKNLRSSAASPYRGDGEAVKGGWHTYPEMAPAGLWTTPSDLAILAIEVQNEYAGKSSKILSQAMMRQMLAHHKDNWGLGFGLEVPGHQPHFGHGGANEGFQCDLEAYTESGQGVAIMSNSDNGGQVIGEILRAVAKEYGWPDFQPKEHQEVRVDPKILEGYVGRYQLAPNFVLTVMREGDDLITQATGQSKVPVFPESEREFFVKDFDAEITFVTDAQGRASELILHQGGQESHAKRMEGEVPLPKEHKEVTVDPKLFDAYVGHYQLAPNFIISVTREGDQLFAQATGQPKAEIFPEREREFFYKVVDAQITFETDSAGRAISLTLRQNGTDQRAKRID